MAELNLNVKTHVSGADKIRGLAGDFAKIAAAAGAAFVGLGAVSSSFASDLNESLSKLNVVFGDNARVLENWADDAAINLGASKQAAIESLGTFGNLFSAMEIAPDVSRDMSKELVQLAADLASFNNIGTDEALEKIRAGIVGEAEPLRTLGVNISAARTEAKALELGLYDGVGALSASAKAQANYALILEDTTLAQGDFARTADGMANQQRTLEATFQDTMASIGQAFIPLIESLLPQITAGMQGFGTWVTDNMPAIQSTIQGILSGIGTGFSFLTSNILPAAGAGFSFISDQIIPRLVAAFSWFTTNVLPGLISVFNTIHAWVVKNWPTISSVIGQAFGAIRSVVEAVWPVLERVASVLFPVIGTAAELLFKAIDAAFKLIGGVFDAAVKAWEFVGEKLFEPLSKGFEAAIGVIKGIWNAFVDFWNGIEITMPELDLGPIGTWGGFTIGLPDLPKLAAGGIVTQPTLALIGESGPEAVVPLTGANGFGDNVNVYLTYSGPAPDTAQELVRHVKAVFQTGLERETA